MAEAGAPTIQSSTKATRSVIGNYSRDERVFHATAMPAAARAAREAVTSQPGQRWDASTALPIKLERLSCQLSAFHPKEYTYNFRSESLPKARPVEVDAFGRIKKLVVAEPFRHTQELPTHPELDSKPHWDTSTTLAAKEKEAMARQIRDRALTATAKASQRLLAGGTRTNPVERQRQLMEELRATRALGLQYREGGRSVSPRRRRKGDTSEDTDAVTLDIAGLSIGRQRRSSDAARVPIGYKHEGMYGPMPGEASGVRAWSCCGNYDAASRGCVPVRPAPLHWCLES